MSELATSIDAKVIGGSLQLDATTALTLPVVAAGATPTKVEFDAVVTALTKLVTQLRADGALK
jgi:hypothetical protein